MGLLKAVTLLRKQKQKPRRGEQCVPRRPRPCRCALHAREAASRAHAQPGHATQRGALRSVSSKSLRKGQELGPRCAGRPAAAVVALAAVVSASLSRQSCVLLRLAPFAPSVRITARTTKALPPPQGCWAESMDVALGGWGLGSCVHCMRGGRSLPTSRCPPACHHAPAVTALSSGNAVRLEQPPAIPQESLLRSSAGRGPRLATGWRQDRAEGRG